MVSSRSFLISLALHILVLTLSFWHWHTMPKPAPTAFDDAMPIELVDDATEKDPLPDKSTPSDVPETQTTPQDISEPKPQSQATPQEVDTVDTELPQQMPQDVQEPEVAQTDQEPDADQSDPKQPDTDDSATAPETDIPAPEPIPDADTTANLSQKMQRVPKAKPKLQARRKPTASAPAVKQKKKQRDLDSILKDLAPSKAKKQKKKPAKQEKTGSLSQDELAIVRQQIEGAWTIPRNVQDIHRLTVLIEITMTPERLVRAAQVSPKLRIQSEAHRILADSALNAVLTFKYKPLKLPPEKYKDWQKIILEFDPSRML